VNASTAPLIATHTAATLRSLLPAATVAWSSSSDFPGGLLPGTLTPQQQRRTRRSPSGFPPSSSLREPTLSCPRRAPRPSLPLVTAIATIQATAAASHEHERAATLALEQEHTMGAALTAQMANVQRLLLGRSSTPLVAHEA
jgi:hypothetical protein